MAAVEKAAPPPEVDGGQDPGPDKDPDQGVARAALGAVRGHWLFTLIFTAGLAGRVLAEIAYRPALLYIDSVKYLGGSDYSEPQGYRLLLRLLDPLGGLGVVTAVQHVFGLAMAAAGYALLVRRRVPRWLAALAVAPGLLDAYQLQLEQTIMPDVLFETMITTGLVLLLWRRRPGLRLMTAGALMLGAAVTVREIGLVLLVPVLIFAVLSAPRQLSQRSQRSQRAGSAVLAGACFLLPVSGYLAGTFGMTGHVRLATNGPGPEYGRAAAAADCATLKLSAGERAVCPSPARTLALGGVDGLLNNPASPGLTVPVPDGTTREGLLASFSLAVLRQQPLRVAAAIARDSVRLFALTRDGSPEITAISRWQFQTFYPTYLPRYTMATFNQLTRENDSGDPRVSPPVATVLRDYQLHGGYTPGPLYALALTAGLAGSLSGLIRRRSGWDREPAVACLLVTLSAVILLLSSDAFEFSWRYQLPAVILLPLAGALGLSAGLTAAARTASGEKGRRTRPAAAESGLRAPAGR